MKKTIAFDFDGVLSTYNGWRGFDVLGQPVPEAIEAVQKLHQKGYRILIWTCRQATPILLKWLKDNKVPYDEINRNSDNPQCTSSKPVYHAFVDDRAVNFSEKFNKLSADELVKQVEAKINRGKM